MGLGMWQLLKMIKTAKLLVFLGVFSVGCVSTGSKKADGTWSLAASSKELSCDLLSFGRDGDRNLFGISHTGNKKNGIYAAHHISRTGQKQILVRPTRKFQMDSDYDSKAIIIDSEQQFLGFTNDLLSYFTLNTEKETSIIEMKSMFDQTTNGQLELADLSGAFSIRLEQYDSKFVLSFEDESFHIVSFKVNDGALSELSSLELDSRFNKFFGRPAAAWRYDSESSKIIVKSDKETMKLSSEFLDELTVFSMGEDQLVYAGFSVEDGENKPKIVMGTQRTEPKKSHKKYGSYLPRANYSDIIIRKLGSKTMIFHTVDLSSESIIYGYEVKEDGILGPRNLGKLKEGYSLEDVFLAGGQALYLVGTGKPRERTYELCRK